MPLARLLESTCHEPRPEGVGSSPLTMFEFFFKYPRSVYARGQFALLGAWPKWMLVLLILAAAGRSGLADPLPPGASRAGDARLASLGDLGLADAAGRADAGAAVAAGDHRRRVEAATEHHRRAGGRFPQHGHIRGRFHAPGASRQSAAERRSRQPQPLLSNASLSRRRRARPHRQASRICNPTRPPPASATASSS